jgi:hypothetical protein
VEDHCQGWRLRHRAATRPQGAPLTVILRGERMPGTEDGPSTDFAAAVIDAALRRVPQTCGSGAADLAAAGAPVRASAREGATWPPPWSRTVPTASPHLVLAVVPVSVPHSRSITSRPCLASGPRPGPRRAEGAPLKP